jgi:hypothetical protein
VQLHPSNRTDKPQQSLQSLFPGRKKVVLLASGHVIAGESVVGAHAEAKGASAAAAEAADRAKKVARICASFTAEFPEALFVAPEEPVAPVSNVVEADVEMKEVELDVVGSKGLELEGVPRSIKEAFNGPGSKAGKEQRDSPHAADEAAVGGKAKKRKVPDGQAWDGEEGGKQWAQALGWKSHLRAKMAGESSKKEESGDGGEDAEEFNSFDYAAASAASAAEPKSKRDLKKEAEAMLQGHFSPHHGQDSKAKQVSFRSTPRALAPARCLRQ